MGLSCVAPTGSHDHLTYGATAGGAGQSAKPNAADVPCGRKTCRLASADFSAGHRSGTPL